MNKYGKRQVQERTQAPALTVWFGIENDFRLLLEKIDRLEAEGKLVKVVVADEVTGNVYAVVQP